ncbi:MAG: hypothetical protein Q9188_001476 [Gyalolechia gomerana]
MSSSNGLDQQGSGFARHPRHLPTPIVTGTSSESFRNGVSLGRMEPRLSQSLPSIRHLIDERDGNSNFDAASIRSGSTPGSTPTAEAWQASQNTPRPAFDADAVMRKARETLNDQLRANGYDPNNLPTSSHPINDTSSQPNGNGAEHDNEDPETNPYQERADQIGLSHRIPGIGHLGDLLTPPGWSPGDEPIPPGRARQLQKEAYDSAKKKLEDSISEFSHLKGTSFQEASDVKNEEWQNHNDLNKLIFEERVRVYQAHEDRKANGVQTRTQQLPVLNLPQPNGTYSQHFPPMGVAPARNMQFQRPVPRPLDLSRPSSSYGKPEASPRLLSPRMLDPSLVHGTVQAVVNDYNNRRNQLKQMNHENEMRLRQCLSRYGPHIHPAHQAHQAQPRPQYLVRRPSMQMGMENSQQTNVYYGDRGLTANRYAAPPDQNALGIYDEPTELALTPVKNRDRGATPAPNEEPAQIEVTETPSTRTKRKTPAKKASPKKPTTSTPESTKPASQKKEPWYAADLAAATAHLPPSTITSEEIDAALATEPKGPTKPPGSQPPKKRRRPSEPVPVPDFKMPASKIRALFKSGLPVRYTGAGPNPYLDDESTNGNGGPVVPAMSSKDVKRGKVAGTSASSPLFIDETTNSFSSDRRTSSTESQDDPNDGTYGARRKQGVAKMMPRKGKSVLAKRGKREE